MLPVKAFLTANPLGQTFSFELFDSVRSDLFNFDVPEKALDQVGFNFLLLIVGIFNPAVRHTGENAAQAAYAHEIRLEGVKIAEARKGFILLPRRWVVERSFGLGGTIAPIGARLRALAGNACRIAFFGVCRLDAQTICRSYDS